MIEKMLRALRNYQIKMPSNKTDLKLDFETEHFHIPIKFLLVYESNFFRSNRQDVFGN